jgi:hypothetical protein
VCLKYSITGTVRTSEWNETSLETFSAKSNARREKIGLGKKKKRYETETSQREFLFIFSPKMKQEGALRLPKIRPFFFSFFVTRRSTTRQRRMKIVR